jgi:hypothetical protein
MKPFKQIRQILEESMFPYGWITDNIRAIEFNDTSSQPTNIWDMGVQAQLIDDLRLYETYRNQAFKHYVPFWVVI